MPVINRVVRIKNGKKIYDPPMTPDEVEADRQRFAEMCRVRKAPGTMGTDRAFLEGQHNHGFTEEPDFMQGMLVTKAKEAGINITGKKYVGGLADHRGPKDPMAWVSDTHEALAVAKARNLDVTGVVNHRAHEVDPPKDVPLAENRIRDLDRMYAAKDPSWKRKRKQERREAIIDAHGAPAKNKGARKAT